MVDVAVEVYARLHPPVPAIFEQEGVPEEKSRVESTHISVRYTPAVGYILFDQLISKFGSSGFVDTARLHPVFSGNETELDRGGSDQADSSFEVVGEGLLVEEDVGVVVMGVEAIFNLTHAL